ncbi:MAG: tetratricopeptide repeat protein, partial [Candidatus Adiutrix sp.]|nr:tetratricopeptide repeat protein [Candidatus Adiutrix sp.]
MKLIRHTLTLHLAALFAALPLLAASGCAHAAGWDWLPGAANAGAESYYRFLRACYEEIDEQPKKALGFMQEAYALSGKSPYLRLETARLFSLNGDHQNGLKFADDAIAQAPGDSRNYFMAAMIAARNGLWDKAEKYYRDILKLEPKNADAYMLLGALFRETGKNGEAEAVYKQWTTADPGYLPYYYLGDFYHETGRNDEAVTALNQCIRRDPEFVTAHLELAQLYEDADNKPGQEKMYRALIKLLPDENKLKIRLGLLLLDSNRRAEASKAFRDAAASSEDPVRTHLQIGQLYVEKEAYADAAKEFETALKIDPAADQALYLLSWILLKQSNEAGAKNAD